MWSACRLLTRPGRDFAADHSTFDRALLRAVHDLALDGILVIDNRYPRRQRGNGMADASPGSRKQWMRGIARRGERQVAHYFGWCE